VRGATAAERQKEREQPHVAGLHFGFCAGANADHPVPTAHHRRRPSQFPVPLQIRLQRHHGAAAFLPAGGARPEFRLDQLPIGATPKKHPQQLAHPLGECVRRQMETTPSFWGQYWGDKVDTIQSEKTILNYNNNDVINLSLSILNFSETNSIFPKKLWIWSSEVQNIKISEAI
jgi:hypothetical protein